MYRRLTTALLVLTVLAVFAIVTLVGVFPTVSRADSGATAAGSPQPVAANTPAPAPTPAESKIIKMLGGGPADIKLTAEEQRFVDLTNQERTSRGLNALTVAPLLVKAAREKSKEMCDLNYWGHESPVPEKRTEMRRVLYYLPEKPQSMVVGENLYFCSQVLVDSGHKALMESPTHRKNILNPEYDYIGIGAYIAPDGRFWVTEVFLHIEY